MIFHTPPECQGQIVETSYAADGERVLRLTVDRSDRSACLSSAPLEELDAPFEPWNEEPPFPTDTVWTPCTLQSDGEQWCLADADGYLRPLGFALLDSSPYKGMLAARGEAYAWKGVGHWQFADGHTERADAVLDAFDHPGVVITSTHPAAAMAMRVEALEHDSCGRCGAVGPHFSMHTGDGECLCSKCLEAERTEAGTEEGAEGEQAIHPGPIPDTFIAVPLGPELPLSAMPGVLEALASEIPLTGPTRESERKVLAAMARRDRG